MKGFRLSVLIAVFFTVSIAPLASAHSTASTAKKQYYHADGYIKAIGKNAARTIYHPNPKIKHKWQKDLAYLVRVRHRAYLVLHPAPRVSTSSHYAMWLCIHGKEGPWDANTGNGYFGGLQATSPWYGVDRMDLLSADEQIAHAEAEYAAHGYGLWWIRQQWPNTSYGCI